MKADLLGDAVLLQHADLSRSLLLSALSLSLHLPRLGLRLSYVGDRRERLLIVSGGRSELQESSMESGDLRLLLRQGGAVLGLKLMGLVFQVGYSRRTKSSVRTYL